MTTIKCGVGGRGGKDGSPVVLSVSIRYFLHMCCYINKEYGVIIPELGKKNRSIRNLHCLLLSSLVNVVLISLSVSSDPVKSGCVLG